MRWVKKRCNKRPLLVGRTTVARLSRAEMIRRLRGRYWPKNGRRRLLCARHGWCEKRTQTTAGTISRGPSHPGTTLRALKLLRLTRRVCLIHAFGAHSSESADEEPSAWLCRSTSLSENEDSRQPQSERRPSEAIGSCIERVRFGASSFG